MVHYKFSFSSTVYLYLLSVFVQVRSLWRAGVGVRVAKASNASFSFNKLKYIHWYAFFLRTSLNPSKKKVCSNWMPPTCPPSLFLILLLRGRLVTDVGDVLRRKSHNWKSENARKTICNRALRLVADDYLDTRLASRRTSPGRKLISDNYLFEPKFECWLKFSAGGGLWCWEVGCVCSGRKRAKKMDEIFFSICGMTVDGPKWAVVPDSGKVRRRNALGLCNWDHRLGFGRARLLTVCSGHGYWAAFSSDGCSWESISIKQNKRIGFLGTKMSDFHW